MMDTGKIRDTNLPQETEKKSPDRLAKLRQEHHFPAEGVGESSSQEGTSTHHTLEEHRKNAKEALDKNPQLLLYAYNAAKHKYSENSQITMDLKTIQEFKANNQTLKAAMSRIVEQTYDKPIIQRAANLIKFNPEIKPFYNPNEGQIQAEPGPQDTDNIIQKRHKYLDKIPDKTITDLSEKLRTISSKKRSLNSFKSANDACNKIKLFLGLYTASNRPKAEETYGHITKDDASIAAIHLRNALNQEDLNNVSFIASYRKIMNQYYQET